MKTPKSIPKPFVTLWEEYLDIPCGTEEVLNQLIKRGEIWRGKSYVNSKGIYFVRNFHDANRFRFYLQIAQNGPAMPGGEKIIIEKYSFFVEVNEVDNHTRIKISYKMDNLIRFTGPVGIGVIVAIAAITLLTDTNKGFDLFDLGIIGGGILLVAMIRWYQKYYTSDLVEDAWPALGMFIEGMGWTKYQDREKYPAPSWAK